MFITVNKINSNDNARKTYFISMVYSRCGKVINVNFVCVCVCLSVWA